MANIGLLFGSFNPVHIGHLALANYMLATQPLDEVWLVVSPQNPFKDEKSLIDGRHRLQMVKLALGRAKNYKACDIELHLPLPSYTARTLEKLRENYPHHSFSIIMGADNYLDLGRWKDYESVLKNHHILVYPRPGSAISTDDLRPNVTLTDAPLLDISSTLIRKLLAEGRDVTFFVPHGVAEYINAQELYLM